MSPTEDDLRTALSDGAGDVPDAEHIMFVATRQRAQRQKRILSAAAAVIVVGGVATGVTVLARHGSTESAGGAGAGNEAAAPAARGSAQGTTASGGGGGTAGCPSTVPSSTGVGSTPNASGDRLFAEPVSSALVCSYPSGTISLPAGGASGPSSIRLTGSDATTLTDSLENATRIRPGQMCSDLRTTSQRTIVVLARTSDGTQLAPVTTTINEVACAVVVTNGTVTRYAWTPPAALQQDFARLTPTGGATGSSVTGGVPTAPATQRLHGSPVH